MRDNRTTKEQTLKIELLSQWKLEAEFRKKLNKQMFVVSCSLSVVLCKPLSEKVSSKHIAFENLL